MSETSGPRTISVLIATYNRAALLDECLAHLHRQQFRPGDEVIIADNGSTDDTRTIVARSQGTFPVPLVLVHEPLPGKSRAIARALAAAKGDILAFTDDDVNVDSAWIDTIRRGLADPAVAMVGGPVHPRFEAAVPMWIRKAWEKNPRVGAPLALVDYGPVAIDLGRRTLLGANLAVRRTVFEQVGGFPTHLGKLRGTLLSGEDHVLCRRVQDAGYHVVYSPLATVHHWVPASRTRLSYFVKWFFWSGITHAIMETDAGNTPRREIAGFSPYLIRRAVSASAATLAAALTMRRTTALGHAIDVAFAAGYSAGRRQLAGAARRVSTTAPAGEPL